MSITVTDKGAYIQVDDSSLANQDSTKTNILKGYVVNIKDGYVRIFNKFIQLHLKYSDISSPASTDIEDLRNTIMQYNNSTIVVPIPVGASTSALQTAGNATLSSILAALQSGQEFEQNLITDATGATYLQIRIFNEVTHTFNAPVYYDAAGSVVVPVAPLVLVNPQTVLNNILTQVTATNATTAAVITSTLENTPGAGTVTAGAVFVNFFTSDDFIGSINGIARVAYTSYIMEVKGARKTLPAIPFVITSGSITIDKIV